MQKKNTINLKLKELEAKEPHNEPSNLHSFPHFPNNQTRIEANGKGTRTHNTIKIS